MDRAPRILLNSQPASAEQQRMIAQSSVIATLDKTILFSCEWRQAPEIVPPLGFFGIQLVGNAGDGGVIGTAFPPGAKMNWGAEGPPNDMYLCRFTNFGQISVVNLRSEMKVSFFNVVKIEGGARSGEVAFTKMIPTPVADIGTGDRNIYEFYVHNRSEYYVEVTYPEIAHGQRVGGDQPEEIKLIQRSVNFFGMMPFGLTSQADSEQRQP